MLPFGHASLGSRIKASQPIGRRKSMSCVPTTPAASTATQTNPGSRLDRLKTLVERGIKSIMVSNSNDSSTSARRSTIMTTYGARVAAKKKRRRTVVTEMIGFPQDFVHSSHIGVHEVRQLAYQPRHSTGPTSLSLFQSSGKLSSVYGLPEREGEFHFMDGRDELIARLDMIRSNDSTNTLSKTSVPPTRPVEPAVPSNKVKRKLVPVHVLQEVSESIVGPQEVVLSNQDLDHHDRRIRVSCLSIDESLKALIDFSYDRSNEPVLDEKGRPLHMVGGEYMTETVKGQWDKKMAEVARSLKADKE